MRLVDHHALVLLGRGYDALVCIVTFFLHAGLLANDVEHGVLECLLVLAEPVLLPGVVKHAMVEAVTSHARLKEVDTLAIVWLLLEVELATVLHILTEFGWVPAAKLFKRGLNLLLLDVVVLLVLGATWQALPGELSFDQVEQNMTDSLQIVSPGLLDALVRGNRGISGRARQILSILVGDVLTFTVFVALGQTEIDDVDIVPSSISSTDEEVIGLDITMDDALFVDLLDAADELTGDHQYCLQVKVALARLE